MVDLIKAFILANGYVIIGSIGGLILSRDRRMEDFGVGLLMFLLGLHINTTVLMLGSIEWYRGVTKGYEFTMMEILSVSLIFSTIFKSKRSFFRGFESYEPGLCCEVEVHRFGAGCALSFDQLSRLCFEQ